MSTTNELRIFLGRQQRRFRRAAFGWKWFFRVLLVLSAFLSAGATVMAADVFGDSRWKDTAETLSVVFPACVTVIATLIAALDFDTNWRANRVAKYQIEMLMQDLEKTGADENAIRDDFKKVINQRLEAFEKKG